MQTLNVLSWNVEGIVNKIGDLEFVKFISEFDILVFFETWASKPGLIKLIGYDSPLEKVTDKKTKFGHNPGGIMVLYRSKYKHCIKELQSQSEQLLWFKISISTTCGTRLYIFCALYLHPEGSKYANLSTFDILEDEFLSFKQAYPDA